jgi:hypothetical protein
LEKHIKGGFGLLFFIFALNASANTVDENQLQFKKGVDHLFNSEFDSAEKLFKELYLTTGASRVKLEWARAAYYNGNYDNARKLFQDVMNEDIPEAVKFNISIYMDKISERGTRFDYRINYVREKNPSKVSKSQTVIIYGLPFQYRPVNELKTSNGINLYAYFSKGLNHKGDYRVIGDVDLTEYERGIATKQALRLSFEAPLINKFKYSFGRNIFWQNEIDVMSQDHLSLRYTTDGMGYYLNSIEGVLKHSINTYPESMMASGYSNSILASIQRVIDQNLSLTGNIYYDDANAGAKSFEYQTSMLGVDAKIHTPSIHSYVKISLSKTLRKYKGIDELFIKKRKDESKYYSIVVEPYKFKVAGLFPYFEISKEELNSNISINSFENQRVNFGLKKRY